MTISPHWEAAMKFEYEHNIATIEQAMAQALVRFVSPGVVDLPEVKEAVSLIVEATLSEIRTIQSADLSTLFDIEGVAVDWNEAIEQAIRCIEGDL